MTYKAMKPKVIASIVLFNHSYDDIKDTLLSLCHEESVEKIIFVDNGGCQWAASLNEPKVSYIKEGANKRGNSSRLTQSFHFFMFEPIFSPVNALNQPI
ncbi:hypothetical protein SGJ47_12575 [Klebsiella pneumoniae]|uniref:hypothetical protein n=1 Tax=Klebsiella pneumoniae TaxID=573 RepID=UPI0029C06C86|nr:hypothetical protein [Klebsiella pneumoniae]WPG57514.1 hypothetical protein SGJ47_12575 [Klebsiella pneumoniae]